MKNTAQDNPAPGPAERAAAAASRGSKRSKGKAGQPRKRGRRSSRKPAEPTQAGRGSLGVSQSAQQLITRGRRAVAEAYGWLEEAGANIPAIAGRLPVPSQTRLREAISDRPILIGVIGLGLGAMAGALLIASRSGLDLGSAPPRKRRATHRARQGAARKRHRQAE